MALIGSFIMMGVHAGQLQEILKSDKPRYKLGRRALVNVLRGIILLDDALVHNGNLVRNGEALLLVMGNEQGRDAKLFLQTLDLHTHAHAQLRVQVAERLIQKKEFRLNDKRSRQCHTLSLAAGHLLRKTVCQLRQSAYREDLLHFFIDGILIYLAGAQAKRYVVIHAQVREQRVTLEYQSEISFVNRNAGHILTVQGKGAARRLNETGNHTQGRGLAAAARPQKGYQLAFFHIQVQAL